MQDTKLLTSEKLEQLRYPLPKSWLRAAGILRHKKGAMERHLLQIRREWNRNAAKR